MLLLMLGAVLVLMRQLEQPETAAYLDRVFSPTETNAEPPPRRELPGEPSPPAVIEESPAGDAQKPKLLVEGPWAAVKDNAMFLPAEHNAWFLLWGEARRLEPAELDRQMIAETTYAQLVNQPAVYRGQAVQLRGRILRESLKKAPENDLGITEYHQLVLAPIGGGDWPVILYCLNLPPGFPRGDGLHEDVVFTGLFFKNWSSPHEEGMGLFPVLVAKSFNWRPPQAPPTTRAPGSNLTQVWIGAAVALIAACGFVALVARQTHRPRQVAPAPPDFERLSANP